jgi:alpha-N-arabinofuranosidase
MTRVACYIIAAAWLATVARAAVPAVQRIGVDLGNPGPVISPLLFSFNLEHTRYAMWKGLSAELLANRKFAGPSVADAWKQAKVVRGAEGADGVVARWYGIGKPAAQFTADTKECYAGKQSQRIRVAAGGATGGVGQGEIAVQAGTPYTAQFQLKAASPMKVVARLCDASGHKQYASQSLAVEQGDWHAWIFRFQAPQTDLHAKLEVTFQGPGTLWLGSASLLPADHFHGMRRDVIARLTEISVPMLRWRGGNFTRDYRWKEGLLPPDKRPPIASSWHETLPFTDNYDFHELAIDEYMALCRELGARPSITLTMGIAEGAREAAEWVEYCNGSAQTRWGRVRAERGHEEPYHVQHWTIGNEVWGEWMGPAFYTLERYAAEVKQYAVAMRQVDPSLVLIASGVGTGWDKKLLEQAGTPFDWLSRHEYCKPVTQALTGAAGAQEYARQARRPREVVLPWLKEARQALDQAGGKRVCIAFDEWNIWHDWFVDPFKNEWHVGPIDAVFAAGLLNVLCREAGNLNVPMAAMFQPINEGAIRVEPFSARLTAMGQVFALYRAHQGGRLLDLGPQGDRAVDACASLSADGKLLSVTLVNRAAAEQCPVELALAGGTPGTATATILSVNEIRPDQAMDRQTRQLPLGGDGKVSLVLPRFGIGLVQIDLAERPQPSGQSQREARLSQIVTANVIATHAYQVALAKHGKIEDPCWSLGKISDEDLKSLVRHQQSLLSENPQAVKAWAEGRPSAFDPAKDLALILRSPLDTSAPLLPVNVLAASFQARTGAAAIRCQALAGLLQMMLDVDRDGDLLQKLFALYVTLGFPVHTEKLGMAEKTDEQFLALAREIAPRMCGGPIDAGPLALRMMFRKMWNWGHRHTGERDRHVLATELLAEPDVQAILPKIRSAPPQKIAVIGHSFTMEVHWASPSAFVPIAAEILARTNPKVEIRQWQGGGLSPSRGDCRQFYQEALAWKPDKVLLVVLASGPGDAAALDEMVGGLARTGAQVMMFDKLRADDAGVYVDAKVLAAISRKHGMKLLEVGPLLAASPDRERFVCLDGIHMTEPYHRLMAKQWLAYLSGARGASLPRNVDTRP